MTTRQTFRISFRQRRRHTLDREPVGNHLPPHSRQRPERPWSRSGGGSFWRASTPPFTAPPQTGCAPGQATRTPRTSGREPECGQEWRRRTQLAPNCAFAHSTERQVGDGQVPDVGSPPSASAVCVGAAAECTGSAGGGTLMLGSQVLNQTLGMGRGRGCRGYRQWKAEQLLNPQRSGRDARCGPLLRPSGEGPSDGLLAQLLAAGSAVLGFDRVGEPRRRPMRAPRRRGPRPRRWCR